MGKAELVVEIGTEELPASLIEGAAQQFAQQLVAGLRAERLPGSVIAVWYTPRRTIVALDDLPARQDDLSETILGPPRRVAFDSEGNPTRAASAFAEKNGVALSKTSVIETPKGEYLSVVRKHRGEQTTKVLQRLIPAVLKELQFPKTMYWSPDKFRFARPLRWIVAIYAGKVVKFTVADVVSSRYTSGHRFMGKSRIPVTSLSSLREALRDNGVIVDPAERKERIVAALGIAAAAAGGRLLTDDDLLETVVNLNENPSVVCGAFDRRFLELPDEILVTVMRKHQKYFSVINEEGRLLPVFLAVINLPADPGGKIKAGHERVLRARFADAAFFWNTDRKIPIGDREASLRTVLFQQKLGSYFDKTQRVLALLPEIAAAAGCAGELQELEARAEGYSEKIWRSVYEQYLPKSSASPSPSTLAAAVLALSDKLDTICGCFSADLIPTGSRDPFAVRRQGNGLLKIMLDHRIGASLGQLVSWSLQALGRHEVATQVELLRFFEGRLRFLFEEMGFAYDCVNAALAVGFDDPVDALERVRALQEMRQAPDFLVLASSFKRVLNILAQSDTPPGSPDVALMSDTAETGLWEKYLEILPGVDAAAKSRQYGKALRLMASLRGGVDQFFEQVLVMAEDRAVRQNRFSLLGELSRLFLRVADISQIVLEKTSRMDS
jgi:glycyl-tRNA synthetase beta chain